MSASTHHSKDSSQKKSEIKSKKSKRRKSRKTEETSNASRKELTSEGSIHVQSNQYEFPHEESVPKTEFQPYVSLTCPFCTRKDCILNRAALCPLLRPQEGTKVVNECEFCLSNCSCNVDKRHWNPVSGLVPRDENGVAISLLAVNGGPIGDSYAYANRPKWEVPVGIPWQYQMDQWISAYHRDQDNAIKQEEKNQGKKKPKTKVTRRVSKMTSEMSSEGATQFEDVDGFCENKEPIVLTEGDGFKIVLKDDETILLNYNAKNCRYLNCGCNESDGNKDTCGCDAAQIEEYEKYQTKSRKDKKCKPNKQENFAVVKKLEKDVSPDVEEAIGQTEDKCGPNNPSLNGEDSRKLTANDVLHKSREEILDIFLKTMLGTEYKNNSMEEGEGNSAQVESRMKPGAQTTEQLQMPLTWGPCRCAYSQQ